MRILIIVAHPGNVHLFKNMIWKLEEHGHTVKILAREKEMLCYLLEKYGFEYTPIGKMHSTKIGKAYELITTDYKCYKLARKFNPDILIDRGLYGVHTAKLTGKTSIVFNDSERLKFKDILSYPFTDVICTPACFNEDLGKKQVRFNSYKELAYLHPNYFQPDPSVLKESGLAENDCFVIIRFISKGTIDWHNQKTLDLKKKRRLIGEIERYARVFITSETPLPQEFNKYKIKVPPEKIHHLLYYARMFIGDGATMNTEAAILGTPSIRYSSLTGPKAVGNFVELEEKYGLLYSFCELDKVIEKAVELLAHQDLKGEWAKKRERLLADKIDATQFMVEFIENYPQSFYKCKEESKS